MLHDKMIYYRKKNMLTQEELAEKLCVSRQTITKWENGVITPSLEYLIDLSHIFGITIDHFIKDDDCRSDTPQVTNTNQLVSFLVEAKKSTYASHKNKMNSLRKDSHDYSYHNGKYQYYDSFFGASFFHGQEIIYDDVHVCWSMNYYGKVLSEDFNSEFLKEALALVNEQRPFRGPEIYTRGEYTYISKIIGDFSTFQGSEDIYYRSHKIYEALFHGGMIK